MQNDWKSRMIDESRGGPGRFEPLRLVFAALVGLAMLLGAPVPGAAQNLFAPVARVNDSVITAYELSQRMAFLRLLRAPGDIRALALEQLVQERLQAEQARLLGISLTEEGLLAGMTEFAARANLTPEKFIEAIAQGGVAAETFRDFVTHGLLWREVARARFAPRISISEAEIDRAIAEATPEPGVRVLLSEIMLPADTPANKRASQARAKILSQIDDIEEFAQAAQQYSISATKNIGGQIDWRALSALPPALARMLRGMSVGEVTPPIDAGDRIALFQLRERREIPRATAANARVEYAEFLLPGGRSPANLALAARIDAETDQCGDLYAFAQGQPENALSISTKTVAEIPNDVGLELAHMDAGEVSTAITRNNGQTLVVLMLCGRTNVPTEAISREQVRQQLTNERLAGMAQSFLEELKANAFIEYYDN